MARKFRMRVRKAQDVFSKCPACESPNLIHMDGDSICTYCGWDSIELRVEASFGPLKETPTIEATSEREERAASAAREVIYGAPFLRYGPNVA